MRTNNKLNPKRAFLLKVFSRPDHEEIGQLSRSSPAGLVHVHRRLVEMKLQYMPHIIQYRISFRLPIDEVIVSNDMYMPSKMIACYYRLN